MLEGRGVQLVGDAVDVGPVEEVVELGGETVVELVDVELGGGATVVLVAVELGVPTRHW